MKWATNLELITVPAIFYTVCNSKLFISKLLLNFPVHVLGASIW